MLEISYLVLQASILFGGVSDREWHISVFEGSQKGGFQKGWFGGCSLAGPPNPERGYKKRNDGTQNRNEDIKNGTSDH